VQFNGFSEGILLMGNDDFNTLPFDSSYDYTNGVGSSNFNPSNSVFSPPTDGIYHLDLNTIVLSPIDDMSEDNDIAVAIRVSDAAGVYFEQDIDNSVIDITQFTYSADLQLKAGDVVQPSMFVPSSFPYVVLVTASFDGHLVQAISSEISDNKPVAKKVADKMPGTNENKAADTKKHGSKRSIIISKKDVKDIKRRIKESKGSDDKKAALWEEIKKNFIPYYL